MHHLINYWFTYMVQNISNVDTSLESISVAFTHSVVF